MVMSSSKKKPNEAKVLTAEELPKMSECERNRKLWTQIQKDAKGNEAQKCKAVRAILTDFYKTPEEADELVKQLATESSRVRVEIAKLLQEDPNFFYGLYYELLNILSKDDDPFVKKVVAEGNKRWTEQMKPILGAIQENRNIGSQIAASFKQYASIHKTISDTMRGVFMIAYPIERIAPINVLTKTRWEEERKKLLDYLSILENQLMKEQEEIQKLIQIIKESKKRFQEKTDYIT